MGKMLGIFLQIAKMTGKMRHMGRDRAPHRDFLTCQQGCIELH